MMSQRQSQLRTFRYWLSTLTFTEISIYVVMLVTFIGGLASIFFGIEFALLSILALLLAIVWYLLEATKRTHRLLEAGRMEKSAHLCTCRHRRPISIQNPLA